MPKNNASEMRIQELETECAKLRQWLEEAKRDAQAARRRRHEDLAFFAAMASQEFASSMQAYDFCHSYLLEAIQAAHRKERLTKPQQQAIKDWRREWGLDGEKTVLESLRASLKRLADARCWWQEARALVQKACDA